MLKVEPGESFDFKTWKRQRQLTIIAFLLVNFVGGIDLSIVLATLVPYLQNTFKVQNTNAYFAFITTSFCVSSALFGAASGRIVDRTRRIKVFTSVTLVFQIVGNLIYIIPYSPLFPLFGRLVAGAGEAFTSVCIGEVIRIYDDEGSNRVICWLATVSSIGYVIGPLLTAPLSGIHFQCGPINIDRYNIAGPATATLCAIILVLCQFMIHDCSKMFDMKSFLWTNSLQIEPKGAGIYEYSLASGIHPADERISCSEDEDIVGCSDEESQLLKYDSYSNDDIISKEKDTIYFMNSRGDREKLKIKASRGIDSKPSVLEVAKGFDQRLIFVFSFFLMYIVAGGEVLIPLINYDVMKWDLQSLVWILFAYGTMLVLASSVISKFCTSNRSMYFIGVVSIVSIIVGFSALLCISVAAKRNKFFDIACLSMYVFCLVFVWFLDSIALRSMYGRMVPSELQSFAEAVRNGTARLGMIATSFVTPFMVPYLTVYSGAFMAIGVVMLMVYLSRRKSLLQKEFY